MTIRNECNTFEHRHIVDRPYSWGDCHEKYFGSSAYDPPERLHALSEQPLQLCTLNDTQIGRGHKSTSNLLWSAPIFRTSSSKAYLEVTLDFMKSLPKSLICLNRSEIVATKTWNIPLQPAELKANCNAQTLCFHSYHVEPCKIRSH